jgi:hypothetical protein
MGISWYGEQLLASQEENIFSGGQGHRNARVPVGAAGHVNMKCSVR